MKARYAHTNLVALDWRRLVTFYQQVFGCELLPPERELGEPWLEKATGVVGAALRGAHLRLPGHGDTGPTLEIFQYADSPHLVPVRADRPGFGHIAFQVDDVEEARRAVLAAGGREVGQVVTAIIAGAGTITFVYVADPEGNIVELQRWSRLGLSGPEEGAS